METSKMGLVLFISRNKDNEHIKGFKQRTYQFLTTEPADSVILTVKFKEFVAKGKFYEISRFYYSVNKRDGVKVKKSLLHYLIDQDNVDLSKMDNIVAKIAAKAENKAENRWMLDFDIVDKQQVDDFIAEVIRDSGDKDIIDKVVNSLNGQHIILKHGFNTRNILTRYPNVELKRDGFYQVNSGINKVRKRGN